MLEIGDFAGALRATKQLAEMAQSLSMPPDDSTPLDEAEICPGSTQAAQPQQRPPSPAKKVKKPTKAKS